MEIVLLLKETSLLRTTIIYTTELEDKIIDSESCVNVREWRACVNMGDRLLSKFV